MNVLDEHQEHISKLFATKGADRFGQIDWHVGERGPILHDVHAYLDCTIETEHDAGDHVIVVGRVHELGLTADAGPLLFYQGRYGRLLGERASSAPAEPRVPDCGPRRRGLVALVDLGAEVEQAGRGTRR